MVDGVMASCYSYFDHDLAHYTMAPMQWFPDLMKSTFGEENGSAGFAELTKLLGRLTLPLQSMNK